MTSAAFGEAYDSGFMKTVRSVVRAGVPADIAEEIAQSAWVHGWERISQLRDELALLYWVRTIAINSYRRYYHVQKRYQGIFDMAAVELPNTDSLDLDLLLEQCPEDHQMMLRYFLEGLTTDEIAQRTGATSGAVRLRMMRARRSAQLGINHRINTNTAKPFPSERCDSVPLQVSA